MPATAGKRRTLDVLRLEARRTAASAEAPRPLRLVAIRLLGKSEPETGREVLPGLLLAQQPAEVQSAAIQSLTELNDAEIAAAVFRNWNEYSKAVRQQLLAGASRSPSLTSALLAALEAGKILPIEIDPSTRQS